MTREGVVDVTYFSVRSRGRMSACAGLRSRVMRYSSPRRPPARAARAPARAREPRGVQREGCVAADCPLACFARALVAF